MINLFKPKKNGDDLELKIDKDNLPEHKNKEIRNGKERVGICNQIVG